MIRHRSKKSSLMGVILLLALTAILSACGSDNGNSVKEGNPSASGGTKAPHRIDVLLSHSNSPYAMSVTNWEEDPYVKELRRLSGYDLHFEFLGHTPDYIPQLTTRFASGDLPDLIRVEAIETAAAPGAVDQGAFLELGPLIDQYGPNLKKLIPQDAWDSPKVSKDGKIYGIPTMVEAPAMRVVYARQDWLDKYGIKELKTVDDYMAYFEAIKQDNPGVTPFAVRENLAYSELFFGAYGVFPSTWSLVEGQFIPDMIRPEMKEPIKLWKMMYDKGYINNNLFTNKSADWQAMIFNSNAGLWLHDAPNYHALWTSKILDKSAKLSMLPGPVGPDGHSGLHPKTDGIYFVQVIPSKTENPEEIIKYLDWAWSDPVAQKFFAFGIKDVNYTEENGQVKWSLDNPRNSENTENYAYRISLNPMGAGILTELTMTTIQDPDTIKAGLQTASDTAIISPTRLMPVMESLKSSPELIPGSGAGTLFLDMFAKVITGKEELDTAFDAFVADWKKRGGDKAIQEATEWYNRSAK